MYHMLKGMYVHVNSSVKWTMHDQCFAVAIFDVYAKKESTKHHRRYSKKTKMKADARLKKDSKQKEEGKVERSWLS